MRRLLSNRIDKLEAIGKPIVRIPDVLHVGRHETTAEALARFEELYRMVRGHRLLVVPERDRTAEDEADFNAKFFAQQSKLIADAKSETRKVISQ